MTEVEHALADLHRFIEAGRDRAGVASLASEWLQIRIAHTPGGITPELLHAIDAIRYAREWREFGTPKPLIDFIDKLAGMRPVTRVLDPTCGRGLLLQAVAISTHAQTVHGIDVNAERCAIAQAMLGEHATIFHSDALSSPTGLLLEYDLIVAHPPLGVRMPHLLTLPGLGDRDFGDLAQGLTAWACTRLSERGRVMLILAPSFLWTPKGRTLMEAVHALGCRIDALIHLPGGSLGNTGIPSYLVVFERGAQRDVFIGEFADNAEHQDTLLKLYQRRKSGPQLSLGRLCALDSFRGFEALEAQERLSRLAKATGWEPVAAESVIVRAARLASSQAEREAGPNSLYLRLHGRLRAALVPDEMPGQATRNSLLLDVDPKLADARYLVHWLNDSQIGQATLQAAYRGGVTTSLDVPAMLASYLHLPSLVEQRQILQGLEYLKKVRAEAAELEEALSSGTGQTDQLLQQIRTINQEDRYEDWIESLPFPLASVLWRHHAGSGSVRERFEVLLHFFEATAAFVATVHLSALMSDDEVWSSIGRGLHERLAKNRLSLDRATFGAWKLTVEYLAGQCRKILTSEGGRETCKRLYGTSNLDDIRMLCEPALLEALQRANALRNQTTGHGGAIGSEDAQHIHAELQSLVDNVRGVFGRSWRDYELVQPAEGRYLGGVHHYQAKRMMGTRSAPFATVPCESVQPLESERLYLFDATSRRGLLLRPFIQVMPSPQKKAMTCFIFSRSEPGGSHFVSYHFEQESSLTQTFPEVDEALRRVHQFDKGTPAA
jgi:hypothetical protein